MESLVLGIETSCDETSAAIVKNGREILADITARQEEVHLRFGGVVPELASRKHLESLLPVVKMALEQANLKYSDLHAIAVTNRPGLIGSLIVGLSAAKTLAYALELPLIPVNHLEAHLGAVLLQENQPTLPALGLIISGGHTSLYEIANDWQEFRPLAHTRDDAAGEAFDKGARLLGLPYPGGPILAKVASAGNPKAHEFPRALAGRDQKDFSFSGLKTSLQHYLQTHEKPAENSQALADLCASYQEAIVDSLVNKSVQAVKFGQYKNLVVAGGVAANLRLREKMQAALPSYCKLHVPPVALCTDNGAMIAAIGSLRLRQGKFISGPAMYSVEPSPRTEAREARGKVRV